MLLAAHGTRSTAGQARIRALAAAVARRHRSPVRLAYLDVQHPTLAEAVAALPEPSVVVPLLLSPGYHCSIDIPRTLAGTRHVVAPPLGPDPVLVECLDAGIAAAGPADAVILAAADSSDPRSRSAVRSVAGALRHPHVHPAFIALDAAAVPHEVDRLRKLGAHRVTVAAYLLAEGRFHRGLAGSGATAVTRPLAACPAVVDLVLRRHAAVTLGMARGGHEGANWEAWTPTTSVPAGR